MFACGTKAGSGPSFPTVPSFTVQFVKRPTFDQITAGCFLDLSAVRHTGTSSLTAAVFGRDLDPLAKGTCKGYRNISKHGLIGAHLSHPGND